MANVDLETRLGEADRLARHEAQRQFESPVALEAGAGTGKTATLVARIVVWSLGEGWERALARRREAEVGATSLEREAPDRVAAEVLSRIVAITFTEAAAAEMAERVGVAFAGIAQGRPPVSIDEDLVDLASESCRLRAGALAGALDHLVVRTIHAWCRRLLARHPIEAGLHPDFQVDADGSAQAEVIREVLETSLVDAYGSGEETPLVRLAMQGVGAEAVEAALQKLVSEGVRADGLEEDPLDSERIAKLRGALAREVGDLLDLEAGRLAASIKRKDARFLLPLAALQATRTRCESEPAQDLTALQEFASALAEDWPKKARDTLKTWAKGGLKAGEQGALGDDASAFELRCKAVGPRLEAFLALEPMRLDAARRALAPMLAETHRRLVDSGIATYESLLVDAQRLLRSRGHVAAAVRREIDQLLVDEFQDTNGMQCDIVRCVALEGPEDERPGLFLVGDPKQSIYGWRRADLNAYESFVEEVCRAGGERHRLSINFRSAPVIIGEVDRCMAPVMHAEPGLQPAFEPLIACEEHAESSGFTEGGRGPVEHWLSWGWDSEARGPRMLKVADAHAVEARGLARELRELHDSQGVGWERFAILFRSGKDAEVYLDALRDLQIPYAAELEQSYYRRREIIEAAAWLRCILDPNDQLALLTLLRSASVGVPDVALLPLWRAGLPATFSQLHGSETKRIDEVSAGVARVANGLPGAIPSLDCVEGWDANLVATAEAMGALRESFECDPPDVFVEAVRTLSLLEAGESARYLGDYRVANLDRFFRELQDALVEGRDPAGLLRRLRSNVSEGRDAEEERPKLESQDAVRVMTMHKAKGLDFDHVYIVQLHKGSGGSRGGRRQAAEIHADAQGQVEYRLFGAATPGVHAAEERSAEVAVHEQVRTLYVAMTRAKERLVMTGHWPAAAAPVEVAKRKSHVDLLTARRDLPEDLPDRMRTLGEAGGVSHFDDGGARWRFPALEAGVEAGASSARGEPSESPAPPSAELAERDRKALERFGEEASIRMARSWRGAASRRARAEGDDARAAHDFGEKDASGGTLRASGAAQIGGPVGTAIHRVLEELDLSAPADEELARQRARLPHLLAGSVAEEEGAPALARAEEVFDRVAEGAILERLRSIEPQVLARELPVLCPPDDREAGPVAFESAAIDLVYRDAETDRLVVVDYKTDRVEDERDLALRAAHHGDQGAFYVGALQRALDLDYVPRFELWFLWADRVYVSDSSLGGSRGFVSLPINC